MTEPEKSFLYWIRERHSIYLKKQAGKRKPWTKDKVLQEYYFTNPYRENDKTTVWFRKHVREPWRGELRVLFATACFRWFNLISTGEILIENHLLDDWSMDLALNVLGRVRASKQAVFTGAFMINSPPGVPKLEAICKRINEIWLDRSSLEADAMAWNTMEEAHRRFMQYQGLAGFMAYEIVTDLRHTYFLEDARDTMSWCNPGPGCARGLRRLAGMPMGKGNAEMVRKPDNWKETMQRLLILANRQAQRLKHPPLEMREIEHSLCEWDKYMRAHDGSGRMKRRYQGA